jgi:hypothetical protein
MQLVVCFLNYYFVFRHARMIFLATPVGWYPFHLSSLPSSDKSNEYIQKLIIFEQFVFGRRGLFFNKIISIDFFFF